jgi:hypothetical protein
MFRCTALTAVLCNSGVRKTVDEESATSESPTGVAANVRGYPDAGRPAAGTTCASMKVVGKMRQGPRERCASMQAEQRFPRPGADQTTVFNASCPGAARFNVAMVPRRGDSGLGIWGMSDKYLRKLLIHGARAAIRSLSQNATPLGGWLRGLLARAHPNIAVVALANKLARIAWHVLRRGGKFDVNVPNAA